MALAMKAEGRIYLGYDWVEGCGIPRVASFGPRLPALRSTRSDLIQVYS